MDLDFSKEQDMLRKSVAEFLAKECPFDTVREIEDSTDGYDKKMWKKMAKLGWMELYFPEAYGGLEDPFVDMTIILEEMGKKAFPSPFFATVILSRPGLDHCVSKPAYRQAGMTYAGKRHSSRRLVETILSSE